MLITLKSDQEFYLDGLIIENISIKDVEELSQIACFVEVEHPNNHLSIGLPHGFIRDSHLLHDELDLRNMFATETWLPLL